VHTQIFYPWASRQIINSVRALKETQSTDQHLNSFFLHWPPDSCQKGLFPLCQILMPVPYSLLPVPCNVKRDWPTLANISRPPPARLNAMSYTSLSCAISCVLTWPCTCDCEPPTRANAWFVWTTITTTNKCTLTDYNDSQEIILLSDSELNFISITSSCLPCFYAVGWKAGRASGLQKLRGEAMAGYLSAARCKRFAYGPADATATNLSSLASLKSRMVYLSGDSLPRLSWKKGH